MTENIIYLPLITPVLFAIACLFFWTMPKVQRILNITGSFTLLGVAIALLFKVKEEGIIAVQAGGWTAPFGITLVADLFACIMLIVTGLISVIISLYSIYAMDKKRIAFGFYPMMHFLFLGICGAFITGDVFNLYVWFEVILVSSFVLLTLGGIKAQLEGAIKYVALNFLASAFFLAGIGVLYGLTGTVNMADLALRLPEVEHSGMLTLAMSFFFMAFGIKSAVFPMFFWLPASYHTPPVAVTSLMAGLLTKVGVYALIRFFTLMFSNEMVFYSDILIYVAGFTMVTGVLGAAAQNDFRKILSFHIISQIGYMIMGLALFVPLALAGTVFFIIHNIIVKTNLFLISGVVKELKGSYKLKKLGGVYNKYPVVAAMFAISAFALSGIPPLSGFWPKFMLIKAGFLSEYYIISLIALGVGLLTMFSMTKIWNEVFLKDKAVETAENVPFISRQLLYTSKIMLVLPVIFMVILIISMGIFAEPLINLFMETAHQLLNNEEYINSVFRIE